MSANKVKRLEERLIEKSIAILNKKRISRREEKILTLTVRLIEFTHGFSCRCDSDELFAQETPR